MSRQIPADDSGFLLLATQQLLLTPETSQALATEAIARGVDPAQLAVEQGLLTHADVELVATLLRPGDSIPGYEILGVLGRGGMGVVYRARQINLQRIVALKTISLSQVGQATAAARFEQEAVIAARLQHPHIVSVYDFGRHQGRLFLAMELVEGEDLDERIQRQGRLDEPTAWGLIRQAAAGLSHAALAGIVHRDIKPANLLLVAPPAGFPLPAGLPMVKVADFGLAFLAESEQPEARLTTAGIVLGSPHYIPPEQLSGAPVDSRADMYSLGATLYHMLSGGPPFSGRNTTEVIARKLKGDTPPLADLVPELSSAGRALIETLMAPEPGHRPADYAALLERIDFVSGRIAHLAGSARADAETLAHASAPAAVGRPQQARNRKRVAYFLAAAAALIAIAAIVFACWPGGAARAVPILPTQLSASDWSRYLYDGQTLQGWLPLGGGWSPAKDDDGSSVLQGDGATGQVMVRRPLPQPREPVPRRLDHYRLQLGVRLEGADSAEVQFGLIGASGTAPSAWHVLRIEGGEAVLTTVTDRGELRSAARTGLPPPPDNPHAAPQYHELTLERRETQWVVLVNDQPLTAVEPLDESELREFRLATRGGAAFFADLRVTELVLSDGQSGDGSP